MPQGVSRRGVPVLLWPEAAELSRRRRRDKHGRGLRGPLAPSDVPLAKSRAEKFDDLVLDAVERIERRWKAELARIEFAVEDVPSLDGWLHDWVPLARNYPAHGALPPRVVLFRRPLETRALSHQDLRRLVRDVVVEEVASLFGTDPEQVDPGYSRSDDD